MITTVWPCKINGHNKISRKSLELIFKERDICDNPEQDNSIRYWKTPGREERAGNKLTGKDCGKKE
jgi:hypothetical protein